MWELDFFLIYFFLSNLIQWTFYSHTALGSMNTRRLAWRMKCAVRKKVQIVEYKNVIQNVSQIYAHIKTSIKISLKTYALPS